MEAVPGGADTFPTERVGVPKEKSAVSLLSYYQLVLAPFLRARLGIRLPGTGRGDEGASLVEYALLVALIAVVCIIAITFLGRNASDKLSEVGSTVGG